MKKSLHDRISPDDANHIVAKVSGATADDTVLTAAEKVIQTMRDAGLPASAIRKAERMLARAKAAS